MFNFDVHMEEPICASPRRLSLRSTCYSTTASIPAFQVATNTNMKHCILTSVRNAKGPVLLYQAGDLDAFELRAAVPSVAGHIQSRF